jgi:hypothetical protein
MAMKTSPCRIALIAFVLLVVVTEARGQTRYTEHTYQLDDPDRRPAATLADVHWLVGDWYGEAFGDSFEEAWSPPSAGSMVGMFKLLKDSGVAIYELELLVEEEGSLSLMVRHFNADFTAWEDKDDYVYFPLVQVEENAVHFSGISFYRLDPDRIDAYLVLRNSDDIREEKLVYRRR